MGEYTNYCFKGDLSLVAGMGKVAPAMYWFGGIEARGFPSLFVVVDIEKGGLCGVVDSSIKIEV